MKLPMLGLRGEERNSILVLTIALGDPVVYV